METWKKMNSQLSARTTQHMQEKRCFRISGQFLFRFGAPAEPPNSIPDGQQGTIDHNLQSKMN